MNEVWIETAQFLANLNGENISRDSYVRMPEYTETEKAWIGKKAEWTALLDTLPEGQQRCLEKIRECLEDFASAMEKRAYAQGYVDCVQVLYHLGILKGHPGLKVPEGG